MLYCHKCGAELPENTNYCTKCGAIIVSQKKDSSISQNSVGKIKAVTLIVSLFGILFLLTLPLMTGFFFGSLSLFQLGGQTNWLENGYPYLFGYLFCLFVASVSTWLIWKKDWWYLHIVSVLLLIATQSSLCAYLKAETGYRGSILSPGAGFVLPLICFSAVILLPILKKQILKK